MKWNLLYKSMMSWLLVVAMTFSVVLAAETPAAEKPPPTAPQITGNPAVDETFAGIERASGWTDRALMLGMLVIVLLMCGYFLKMANDEIKRQRILSAEATKQFTDKIAELTKEVDELSREAIKQITLNTTAMQDYSRMSESNRAVAERVVRTLERVEVDLSALEREHRGRGFRDDRDDKPPRRGE